MPLDSKTDPVVIAGASGFIGSGLIQSLIPNHRVIALSRFKPQTTHDPAVEWRTCDLFSLRETESAMQGGGIGIYLVHSMLPSATLSQSTFYDLDLLVAENFAKTAQKYKFKQIIYLGGLIPEDQLHLSQHLQSRLEVERALTAYSTPVTVLRAGLILGTKGSSFQIMARLVKRLPALACPAWTATKNQPVHFKDVITSIIHCLNNPQTFGKTFDLAGPDIVTYRQMMQQTAKAFGLKRFFISVPIFSPKISRLWVQLFTGAPSDLIAPLIESLRHPMTARAEHMLKIPGFSFKPFAEALDETVAEEKVASNQSPYAFRKSAAPIGIRTVRSVQRLPLPQHRDAEWVALQYMEWLPKAIPFILRVEVSNDQCTFSLAPTQTPLLVLFRAPERSTQHRQLFYIRGGLLAGEQNNGRLEFREALGGQFILAAIHDYLPTLPWFVYRVTQALIHAWVMRRFSRHLQSFEKKKVLPA